MPASFRGPTQTRAHAQGDIHPRSGNRAARRQLLGVSEMRNSRSWDVGLRGHKGAFILEARNRPAASGVLEMRNSRSYRRCACSLCRIEPLILEPRSRPAASSWACRRCGTREATEMRARRMLDEGALILEPRNRPAACVMRDTQLEKL